MELTISRSGTIISETSKFSNMELILSIPQNTSYQKVLTSGIENGKIEKSGESTLLYFRRSDTIGSFTYNYISSITTNRRTINFPLSYSDGLEKDLITESQHVLINEDIRNKAVEITQNTNEDLEKVALLAIWVNENMEYDIKEVGKNSDSIKVYQNMRGVCVEYTNLFLAMVRSLGIPARAVTGYVYSPDYGWQLHSWAEVYLDEWVGVDPTWLEVGSIDATHIPLYFNHDTVLKESVSATLHSQVPLKWIGKGTLGSSTEGIEIKSINEESPIYNIKLVPDKELQMGKEGAILIEIDVDYYMIFQANVNPCKFDDEIIKMEKQKVNYFLKPGKNYVPINFKVSDMINSNYNYFCPIVISHTLGYDVVELNVQGRGKTNSFDIYLSKINDRNVSFKIYSNDGKPVKFITEKNQTEFDLYTNTLSEEISVIKEGINPKKVIFYNSDTLAHFDLDNLNLGTKEIMPTKICFKEKVPNDIKSFIEMEFEFSNGDEMTITYFVNNVLVHTEKTMDRNYTFVRELDTKKIGKQNIVIKVNSYSEEFVYENTYEVYEPKITYEVIHIEDNLYGISVDGPVKDYQIYVNGKKMNSNKTEFEKGDNEIKIVWVDVAGYERTYTSKYSTEGFSIIVNIALVVIVISIIYFFRENIMGIIYGNKNNR